GGVRSAGTLTLVLALIALAALAAFYLRQRRAPNPLYDLKVAARRTFWVAACAGIIVFGSLMAAAFVSQQYLQNVLGYSTLEAGAAVLPPLLFIGVRAPPCAQFGQARRVTRRALHAALRLRLPARRLRDDAAHLEGRQRLLGDRRRLRPNRHRRRVCRHARVSLAHELGARSARRDGVGHRR